MTRDDDATQLLTGRPHPGRTMLALALGGFTIGTTEFATMGLLPLIGATFQVPDEQVGHAISAYALGVVIGAPLLTVVAARVNRKQLLIALMVGYALANAASAAAPGLEVLVIGRFIAGLPHGAFFGVGSVVGTAVVGAARRGRAVATMMAGLTVANVLGVPGATALGQGLGWRLSFLLIGALGLLAVSLLAWAVPADLPRGSGSLRQEFASLGNSQLWGAFLATAIGFAGMFAIYSYISPTLQREAGAPAALIPWVLALFGCGMTLGSLLAGALADRSVRGTVALGFAATLGACLAFAAVGDTLIWALVALVALGISSQLLGIGLQTRLMDLSPAAPSMGAALCHSALNAANANGAFIGGLVIGAGFGYLSPALAGAALTALGMLIMIFVGPPQPLKEAPNSAAVG